MPTLYCSLVFVWLSSIGVVVPSILQLQLQNNICWINNYEILDKKSSFIHVTVWVVYGIILPNIIMVVTYSLTARALQANTLKHDNNRAMELRNRQNARTVKMFFMIVAIYILLTMPYAVFYFYALYMLLFDPSNSKSELINTLNYTLLIPASANGCVNPIIYARMHRDVNGYLKVLFYNIRQLLGRCNQKKNSGTSSSSSNLY